MLEPLASHFAIFIFHFSIFNRLSRSARVSPVRRASPDPAVRATAGLPALQETFGRALWLGPPLFAAVPETGHNTWLRLAAKRKANHRA
jgi:hypothetical protein